jgi:heme oxygenase
MVAFLYDQIQRGNPMGFFGMVQVLEGTSVAIALTVADQLKSGLGLPPQAMSYLSSHGALDQEHLKFFESLMNQVEDAADQAAIIHAAKVVYRLYGDMLYQLTGSCQ